MSQPTLKDTNTNNSNISIEKQTNEIIKPTLKFKNMEIPKSLVRAYISQMLLLKNVLDQFGDKAHRVFLRITNPRDVYGCMSYIDIYVIAIIDCGENQIKSILWYPKIEDYIG